VFVAMSPSRSDFAVGTIQERHSEAVHKELADADPTQEPEEDVDVRVLDAKFHVLATVLQSSRAVPPVLSDKGEIGAFHLGRGRWRIQEQTWEKQKHILVQVASACRPQITSLPPGVLFIVGCDRQNDGRWYRMLKPDGKPILKGWSPSAEMEHAVVTNPSGD